MRYSNKNELSSKRNRLTRAQRNAVSGIPIFWFPALLITKTNLISPGELSQWNDQ